MVMNEYCSLFFIKKEIAMDTITTTIVGYELKIKVRTCLKAKVLSLIKRTPHGSVNQEKSGDLSTITVKGILPENYHQQINLLRRMSINQITVFESWQVSVPLRDLENFEDFLSVKLGDYNLRESDKPTIFVVTLPQDEAYKLLDSITEFNQR
jgi:hypothetical protein